MPVQRGPYWGLALLCAAGVLNLFDRQIVNILGQDIKADLRLSDAELGLLTGTAFGILYALAGIPLGRLADRVDRIRLITAALALWSAFTSLCGLAASFVQLFVMRMGVGIGEAGSQPASTALIADLFPEERRGSAMSVLLLGAPFGSFLGLAVGGYVGSVWGWRRAFVVAGIPGAVLALTMLLTLREPGRSGALVRDGRSERIGGALQTLAAQPRFGWLVVALTCSTFLVYASGAWFPPLFIRVHGMSTAAIGWYAAIGVGIGGGLGTLGAGIACDLLRSATRQVESKLLLLVLGLSIPTVLATVLSTDRSAALVAMFLFDVCAYGWLGPTVNLIQNAVRPGHRALAIGVCGCVASIVSLGCGLPLVGAISDALAPHEGPNAIRDALALCVPVVALVGAFAHWRVLRSTTEPLGAGPIGPLSEVGERPE
jgi:MFS transporter, Spinster family, sphingosine-1-phosphate transporter